MRTVPRVGAAAIEFTFGDRLPGRSPNTRSGGSEQPDNWQHLGDIVARIVARRYDLSRQYAHVVAELNFGERR